MKVKVDPATEQNNYGLGNKVAHYHNDNNTYKAEVVTKKARVTVKEEFQSFCEETTAHGLGHAAKRTKWFWLIIFVVAFVGNGYHLSSIVEEYLSYPSEDKATISEGQVTFPYVTICNAQPMSISNKNKLLQDHQSKFSLYHQFVHEDLPDIAAMYRDKPSEYMAFAASPSGYFHNLGEEVTEVSHQLRDFVVSCKLTGEDCTEQDFNLYQSSNYYNCYTFHGGNIPFRESIYSGAQDGLSLILYLENSDLDADPLLYDTYSTLGNAAGVRVVVHAPNTMPNPSHYGFDVPPGYSTSIGLTVSYRKRLGEPHGDCSNNKLIENTTYKYTASSCSDTCLQHFYVYDCGCHMPDLPVTSDHLMGSRGFCGTFRNNSLEEWFDDVDCNYVTLRNFSLDLETRQLCECFSECHETFYNPVISQSYWPLEQYQEDFYHKYLLDKPDMNETKAYKLFYHLDKSMDNKSIIESGLIRNNFVRLNVYFRDLKIETITQQASYELQNFWSDLGGTIGLWAGLSLITVVEVFVLTFRLIVLACTRKNK